MLKNKPYYGFLEFIQPDYIRKSTAQRLAEVSISKTESQPENVTASEFVEEVVRRGGNFYNNDEARKIAPFKIEHADTCFVSFPYIDGEERPVNPDFAELDWGCVTMCQRRYGIYLMWLIETGQLKVEDINKNDSME